MIKRHPALSAPQSHCAAFAFTAISTVKSLSAPGPQTLSLQTRNPEPGTRNQPPFNPVHFPNPMIANSLPKIKPKKETVKNGPETVKNGHRTTQNRLKNVKKAPQLVTNSSQTDRSHLPE